MKTNTFIIALLIITILGDIKLYNNAFSEGYKKGVTDGLQKYADHLSDTLSGDYNYCLKNKQNLYTIVKNGELTFACK